MASTGKPALDAMGGGVVFAALSEATLAVDQPLGGISRAVLDAKPDISESVLQYLEPLVRGERFEHLKRAAQLGAPRLVVAVLRSCVSRKGGEQQWSRTDALGNRLKSVIMSLLRQVVGLTFSEHWSAAVSADDQAACRATIQFARFVLSVVRLGKAANLIRDRPELANFASYHALSHAAELMQAEAHVPRAVKSDFKRLHNEWTEFATELVSANLVHWEDIGRDGVRALLRAVRVPALANAWRNLRSLDGGAVLKRALGKATPICTLLARVSPAMESRLFRLMTAVRMGQQGPFQKRFVHKFLATPTSETLLPDITRFVCVWDRQQARGAAERAVPQWAMLGWLFKTARGQTAVSETRLALLWDFLFFGSGGVDSVRRLDPTAQLMSKSIPQYADITVTLMDGLTVSAAQLGAYGWGKVDSSRGVESSFKELIRAGRLRDVKHMFDSNLVPIRVRNAFKSAFFRLFSDETSSDATLSTQRTATQRASPPRVGVKRQRSGSITSESKVGKTEAPPVPKRFRSGEIPTTRPLERKDAVPDGKDAATAAPTDTRPADVRHLVAEVQASLQEATKSDLPTASSVEPFLARLSQLSIAADPVGGEAKMILLPAEADNIASALARILQAEYMDEQKVQPGVPTATERFFDWCLRYEEMAVLSFDDGVQDAGAGERQGASSSANFALDILIRLKRVEPTVGFRLLRHSLEKCESGEGGGLDFDAAAAAAVQSTGEMGRKGGSPMGGVRSPGTSVGRSPPLVRLRFKTTRPLATYVQLCKQQRQQDKGLSAEKVELFAQGQLAKDLESAATNCCRDPLSSTSFSYTVVRLLAGDAPTKGKGSEVFKFARDSPSIIRSIIEGATPDDEAELLLRVCDGTVRIFKDLTLLAPATNAWGLASQTFFWSLVSAQVACEMQNGKKRDWMGELFIDVLNALQSAQSNARSIGGINALEEVFRKVPCEAGGQGAEGGGKSWPARLLKSVLGFGVASRQTVSAVYRVLLAWGERHPEEFVQAWMDTITSDTVSDDHLHVACHATIYFLRNCRGGWTERVDGAILSALLEALQTKPVLEAAFPELQTPEFLAFLKMKLKAETKSKTRPKKRKNDSRSNGKKAKKKVKNVHKTGHRASRTKSA